jgi:predicted nucleic acid-binding protein
MNERIEDMKKLKIYLDTSVISHLKQDDVPEKMSDTLKLWDDIKAGKYEVFISEVTLEEVMRCGQPKRDIMLGYLNGTNYTVIEIDKEINQIAMQFINNGILTDKSLDDCRHIACSIVSGCDIIISWNFKHIVNYRTMRGVKLISALSGYNEVSICTPTILVEGEELS